MACFMEINVQNGVWELVFLITTDEPLDILSFYSCVMSQTVSDPLTVQDLLKTRSAYLMLPDPSRYMLEI